MSVDAGYPAPHYAMPQVVNLAGGSVLKTPKIYLVFYPGYTYETQLQTMASALGASTYWAAVTKDYGVGSIQLAGTLELTGETPPAAVMDSDIQTYLGGKLASGAFGTPDPAPSTRFSTRPRRPSRSRNVGLSAIATELQDLRRLSLRLRAQPDRRRAAAELRVRRHPDVHRARWSNPAGQRHGGGEPRVGRGGDGPLPVHEQRSRLRLLRASTTIISSGSCSGGGGEVGDMCVGEQAPFYKPTDVGFMAQRIWSNSFALAGHDPCVPNIAGQAYFQSAPLLTEKISFSSPLLNGTLETQGVTIPVGQSKTIEVDLFSDGPTGGPWTVAAVDALAGSSGSRPPSRSSGTRRRARTATSST